MTDPGLVAKKLALVETCVEQLRSLARPESLLALVAAIRARPGRG